VASRNRGVKKRKLRDLSREHPTYDELNAVFDALDVAAPDIVCAVLGQAICERGLEDLLRKRVVRLKDDVTWATLTDDKGPLDTFYQKIVMGYAFRLYDENIRDNLHIIRTIRNTLAHAKKLVSLDDPLIIAELQKVKLSGGKKSKLYGQLGRVRSGLYGGKTSFVLLSFLISGDLTRRYIRSLSASTRNRLVRAQFKMLGMPGGFFGLGSLSNLVKAGEVVPPDSDD